MLRPESPHVAQMHEGGANRSVLGAPTWHGLHEGGANRSALRAPKCHGLHEGGANRSCVDRSELQLFEATTNVMNTDKVALQQESLVLTLWPLYMAMAHLHVSGSFFCSAQVRPLTNSQIIATLYIQIVPE